MSDIERAVKIFRSGGLVAFPTETVYGLGADATNADAVGKIFAAKGRPSSNPLIVHVASVDVAKRYTTRWTDAAQALAERFWPGPLTLVLPVADAIAPNVTGSGPTVGLRAPDHPLALELLRAFDGPVAAPSANRSNRVSPTAAQHVRDELGDAVDLVLDGGPCEVGIESTVLDLTRDVPTILRPGAASRWQIEGALGTPVAMKHATVSETTVAASPGQHAVHYAPRTPAYHVPHGELAGVLATLSYRRRPGVPHAFVGLLVTQARYDDSRVGGPAKVLPDNPAGYARGLYAGLRELDAFMSETPGPCRGSILVELPPDLPEWAAVRDRLLRATRPLERLTQL